MKNACALDDPPLWSFGTHVCQEPKFTLLNYHKVSLYRDTPTSPTAAPLLVATDHGWLTWKSVTRGDALAQTSVNVHWQ